MATAEKKPLLFGVGRRKSAIARVFLRKGKGKIVVNSRDLADYLPLYENKALVCAPLEATDTRHAFDVRVNVRGGGTSGQTGAILLGIARALVKVDAHHRPVLKQLGFLTRDSRKVERKKYGQRGARRRFQFTKR